MARATTYRSAVVHDLDLAELDVLGVPPQNSQHQVVHVRDGLVHVPEEHVQKVLLRERGRVGDDEIGRASCRERVLRLV